MNEDVALDLEFAITELESREGPSPAGQFGSGGGSGGSGGSGGGFGSGGVSGSGGGSGT
jgi:hypothetical protein